MSAQQALTSTGQCFTTGDACTPPSSELDAFPVFAGGFSNVEAQSIGFGINNTVDEGGRDALSLAIATAGLKGNDDSNGNEKDKEKGGWIIRMSDDLLAKPVKPRERVPEAAVTQKSKPNARKEKGSTGGTGSASRGARNKRTRSQSQQRRPGRVSTRSRGAASTGAVGARGRRQTQDESESEDEAAARTSDEDFIM